MFIEKLKILKNERCGKDFFFLLLNSQSIVFTPGQFIMLGVADPPLTILNRPFAIVEGGQNLKILYKVTGKGTELLSRKKTGDKLLGIFPLGKGFDLSENSYLLVGGGTGIASVLPCARELLRKGKRFKLIIGLKNKEQLNINDFVPEEILNETEIATEDGSYGYKGTAVDIARNYIMEYPGVIGCGPRGMLKSLYALLGDKSKLQVSVEVRMGCGTGVCFGCVVDTKKGKVRTCLEGPVFKAEEIEEWLI